MPIKGLEKGDGFWGRGKELFLKRCFPSSPIPIIKFYLEQGFFNKTTAWAAMPSQRPV